MKQKKKKGRFLRNLLHSLSENLLRGKGTTRVGKGTSRPGQDF